MIEIKNLTKNYKDTPVFKDFSLDIKKGEITCILGESGSGKTTLLNCIASLTQFSGYISPIKCSYCFQKPNLFPNLTVRENLLIVNANESLVDQALLEFGLSNKKNSYPKHLSGGQAQRVGLLRALLYNAELILLDEPFSSLDIALKFSLINKLKNHQNSKKSTILMVTHDIKEALSIAHRIVLIKDSKIYLDIDNITEKSEQEILDKIIKLGETI